MMRTDDLMVGDPVLYGGTPATVCEIEGTHGMVTLLCGKIWETKVRADRLEPVPLTDGILELNGFYESDRDVHRWWNPSVSCGLYRHGNAYFSGFDGDGEISVGYAHELRHYLKCHRKWNSIFKIKNDLS